MMPALPYEKAIATLHEACQLARGDVRQINTAASALRSLAKHPHQTISRWAARTMAAHSIYPREAPGYGVEDGGSAA